MGIDYIVNRQCKLKQRLGAKFLSLVRKQNRYAFFLRKMAEAPNFTETTIFEDVYVTEQGVVRESTSLVMMRLELGELAQAGLECFTCGANSRQTFGGCWGYIGFPIPGTVEKLLLVTLQSYAKSAQLQGGTGGWRVDKSSVIKDMVETLQKSVKPNLPQEWRLNGLLELSQPLRFSWGPFWKRKSITTDHILSFLFTEKLAAKRLALAAQFLNVFETSVEAGLKEAVHTSPPVADFQAQIRSQLLPFKQFTKACLMAAELGEDIDIITTS